MRFFLILLLFFPSYARAGQQDDVEVNLEALEDYQPPQMFEVKPKPVYGNLPTQITSKPGKTHTRGSSSDKATAAPVIALKRVPIPALKPPSPASFKKPLPQQPQDEIAPQEPAMVEEVLESMLEEPSAAEVYKTLDRAVPGKSEKKPSEGRVIIFAQGDSGLSEQGKAMLDESILKPFFNLQNMIVIRAYASSLAQNGPEPKEPAEADLRRLSLERALSVRDYLTAAGLPASRLIIMPMGRAPSSKPADYAEIYVAR